MEPRGANLKYYPSVCRAPRWCHHKRRNGSVPSYKHRQDGVKVGHESIEDAASFGGSTNVWKRRDNHSLIQTVHMRFLCPTLVYLFTQKISIRELCSEGEK